MRELWTKVRQWWRRRVEFGQEWAFHRARAEMELEELGFTAAEAKRVAARRMGWWSKYQREARRDAGAGVAGLAEQLLGRPWGRSAVAVPAGLLVALAALFAVNPGRAPVAGSVFDPHNLGREMARTPRNRCAPGVAFMTPGARLGDPDPCARAAPWVRDAYIPTAFGKVAWGLVMLVGTVGLGRHVRRNRRDWRLGLYGVTTLAMLSVLGVTLWVTAMQWALLAHWATRTSWTMAVIGLSFGCVFLASAGFRLWQWDVNRRCPACLEPLRMPLERGDQNSMLLDPEEVETVCLEGHGSLTESRWERRFREGGSFWEDLAGTRSRG